VAADSMRVNGCRGPSAAWPARRRGAEEKAGHSGRDDRLRKRQEKSRKVVALDRKNPPFIPQTSRDGAEFAKSAKDGAPSSSFVRELTTKN